VDEFLAENKVGDVVTGRIVDVSGKRVKVELGEGVIAYAAAPESKKETAAASSSPKADLSSMTAMLASKWKSGGGGGSSSSEPEGLRSGQVRSFKISAIDMEKKRIDVELQGA